MKPSDYIRKGWCQGSNATDEHGYCVEPRAENACCWCLGGAIDASFLIEDSLWRQFRFILINKIACIPVWNDAQERKREEVIAIAEAVEKELGLE